MNNSPGWSWPAITTSNSAYGNFPMYNKSSATQSANNNVIINDNNPPFTGRSITDTSSSQVNNLEENKSTTANNYSQEEKEQLVNANNKSEPAVNVNVRVSPTVGQQQQQQQVGSGESGQHLVEKIQLDTQEGQGPPPSSTLKHKDNNSESLTNSKNNGDKKVAFEKSSSTKNNEKQQQQRLLYRSKSQGGVGGTKSQLTPHQHRLQHFEASPQYQRSQLTSPQSKTEAQQVIRRNPSAPQINCQPKLNLSHNMRRMTNKPKFHLCGKCTKCKIISTPPHPSSSPSSGSSSGVTTMANFQKKQTSTERGYSATIFPR